MICTQQNKNKRMLNLESHHTDYVNGAIELGDTQTGVTVHTFYGDVWIGYPIVTRDGMVVAGDGAGQVLFLRWVGNKKGDLHYHQYRSP
jgi:hypothetical protein